MSTLATKATPAQNTRAQEVREHVINYIALGGTIKLYDRLNNYVGEKYTLEHTPWEKDVNPYLVKH